MICLKRAYDPPGAADGERFLVERLWPRGVKKEALALSGWLRDLAPSAALRTWYGHDPEKHEEFARRYREELAAPEKQAALRELAEKTRAGAVTLVFATKEVELSNARVLKEVVEGMGPS